MNRTTVRLLLVFVAVLLGSGLLVYVVLDRSGIPATNPPVERPLGSGDQSGTNAGSPEAPKRNGSRRRARLISTTSRAVLVRF